MADEDGGLPGAVVLAPDEGPERGGVAQHPALRAHLAAGRVKGRESVCECVCVSVRVFVHAWSRVRVNESERACVSD